MNLSYLMIVPELILICAAFLILILDLVKNPNPDSGMNRLSFWISGGALILSAGFLILQYGSVSELFGGRLRLDDFGIWLKGCFLLSTLLVLMILPSSFQSQSKHLLKEGPEFLATLLLTLVGMLFLVSSRDLITLYVSLELATIPLFALTAWSRNERSGEAGLKYLVMGAIGSAFLLYGFGFLYALGGEMSFAGLTRSLASDPQGQLPLLTFSAILALAGVGFKLTLVPFHMWAPDAYQGAPTGVTAFLSTASKTTGLVLGLVLFVKIFGHKLDSWIPMTALLATLTMSLGNLVAMRQQNLKRFMAFSSISQAGYLLLGFLSNKPEAVTSAVFYILVYILTNLAAFGVILLHIDQTGREEIDSLKGLSRTSPAYALILMVALFGLAGIPPLSGFVGKFFLFGLAAERGLYWLVAVAALNSTVSLYYYLRLVRQMYIENPSSEQAPLQANFSTQAALFLTTVASVVLGLLPQIIETIQTATSQWLKLL